VERRRLYQLRSDLDEIVKRRSKLLLATVQYAQPEVFLVDYQPLGFKGEVLPTLRWIGEHLPHTRRIVGLPDIVGDPHTTRQEWQEQGVCEVLEKLYDQILVYGQKDILDIATEYALPLATAAKVHYTGYIGGGIARLGRTQVRQALGLRRERLVVVHVDGSGDGVPLLETFLQAKDHLPADVWSVIVTGPLIDRNDVARLRRHGAERNVQVVEYLGDLYSYIAAADLSVSLGGYNTVCEVLSAGVPAVIVAPVSPRQDQYIRAQRLAARGLVQLLVPTSLTPAILAAHVEVGLLTPRPVDRTVTWDGGRQAAQLMLAQIDTADVTYIPEMRQA
jgi:predicted glycosyltransferase